MLPGGASVQDQQLAPASAAEEEVQSDLPLTDLDGSETEEDTHTVGESSDYWLDSDSDSETESRQKRGGRASSEPPPLRRGMPHHSSRGARRSIDAVSLMAHSVGRHRRHGRRHVRGVLARWEQHLLAREAELAAQANAVRKAQEEVQRLMLRVKSQAARTLADAADVECRQLEVSRLTAELRERQESALPVTPSQSRRLGKSVSQRGDAPPAVVRSLSRRGSKKETGLIGFARHAMRTMVYILVSGAIFTAIMMLVSPPPAMSRKAQMNKVRVVTAHSMEF